MSKERDTAIRKLRMDIHDYADDDTEYGWLIVHSGGRNYHFPKRALIHYVFGNMNPLNDILPEYEAFSPSGVKLQMDNRFHTDVWLGAGFDLDQYHDWDSATHDALAVATETIEAEMSEIVKFDFTIIVNGMKDRRSVRMQVYEYDILPHGTTSSGNIFCQDPPENKHVRHRAIVIPRASIEYDLAAQRADVIITEQGGPLSHLATVSRERGKVLIRVNDAVARFPAPFTYLNIDFDNLTLECENY